MKDAESARSVVDAVVSNPKVVAATVGGGVAMSAATNLGVIQGWLSVVSMSVAILTGLVVLVYHLVKVIRITRALLKELKYDIEVRHDD